MAALRTQLAITHICHALTAQENLVAKLQADLEPLKEAETLALLIDIEPAPGPSLDECTHKLHAAESHLHHLQGKLSTAIYYWHQKNYHKTHGQPWLRLRPRPAATALQPTVNLKTNPSVSTTARYTQAKTGPTINPRRIPYLLPVPEPRPDVRAWRKTAWWRDRKYTKLVSAPRSRNLVPHCPLRYGRRAYLAPKDRFADEVARQNARGRCVAFRTGPDDPRADPECDPEFWEKQLWGKGDIFRRRGGLFEREGWRVEEGELSPGQVEEGFMGFVPGQYMPGAAMSLDGESTEEEDSEWSRGSDYEMIDNEEDDDEDEEWALGDGTSPSPDDGALRVPKRVSSFEIW